MDGLEQCVAEAFEETEGPYPDFATACVRALETTISPRKKENVLVLFEERKNEIVYRGFLRGSYMLYRGKLGAMPEGGFKTLYVTHAAIYPTGGKFALDLSHLQGKVDAVYLEAVLDDEFVLPYLVRSGWTRTSADSANVFRLF